MGKINASKVDEWLTPQKLELIKCWARDFTLGDVAKKMGISHRVLIEWRKKYPQINEAIKEGKEVVDYKVENALLKVALGYTTVETKVIIGPPDKNGNRKERIEKVHKELPPNPTAIMCWLNNRKPENWKRNRDQFRTDDKDSNITVNIIRKGSEDKDEDWEVNATSKEDSKGKVKNSYKSDIDLDEWPDDWEDD